MEQIPTINFHILAGCNMSCVFCYAVNLSKPHLVPSEAIRIVKTLPQEGFKKINFAGGEPMLYPGLNEVIRAAKECGMTTSMVTNGTGVTDEWLGGISRYLDWLVISIDSVNPQTNRKSGRMTKDGPTSTDAYTKICHGVKRHGIRLKVNTVVSCYNWEETMADFIRTVMPERWKIMRALPIEGQNDGGAGLFEVTDAQFAAYLERNRPVNGVTIVPEDNNQMLGSYLMIDPKGCLFDNTEGRYTYSQPILQIGIKNALKDVTVDHTKFAKRGGYYDW